MNTKLSKPLSNTEPSRPVVKVSHQPVKKYLFFFIAAVILVIGWFSVSAVASIIKVIGTPSNNASPVLKFLGQTINPDQLTSQGDGRINILLIGIGGSGHAGGDLADTIMVASIEPTKHKIALLSIPRDLRVTVPGHGVTKINAAQVYGEMDKKGNGPNVLKDTVSTVLDIPIHYYVRVDFAGFKSFVDKIGGVTVDVKKAISDPLYPAGETDGYAPFYLKAGVTQMNGDLALKFARSRETTSDFDRASRQQQLMAAIKIKLLTPEVIANPKRITDLLSILGNHVKTDLGLDDLQPLATIVKDAPADSITNLVLDTSPDSPLTSLNDGGYYLVPKSGTFRELQRMVHAFLPDPYLAKEAAKVALINATGKPTETQALKLDLESLGYTIVSVAEGTTTTSTVVDHTQGKKPFTVTFLAKRFAVTATQASADNTVAIPPDITVTVGKSSIQATKK